MNSTVKTVVFWLVIVLSAFLLWQVVKAGSREQKRKKSTSRNSCRTWTQGNVKEVTIIGHGSARQVPQRQFRLPHHRPGELSGHDQDAAR